MNDVVTPPLGRAKQIFFTVMNVLIPGLGFLLKREFKQAALNFFGFLAFLFIFPIVVGHENQAAVPWGYAFAMLGSGLVCWGEPL